MEFVQKIADFIMAIVRIIKELIANVSGKAVAEEPTTGA